MFTYKLMIGIAVLVAVFALMTVLGGAVEAATTSSGEI